VVFAAGLVDSVLHSPNAPIPWQCFEEIQATEVLQEMKF